MSAVHGFYARWRKIFEHDGNTRTANFYRFWNEVPTILLLIIVAMAVAKPF
jgi:protoporphyrinogen IX oxidase